MLNLTILSIAIIAFFGAITYYVTHPPKEDKKQNHKNT